MESLATWDGDVRARRLRHPPRGRGRQGVEHRPRLGGRRRDDADPRRRHETEQSLAARGEDPVPVERIMRDPRINPIFEGSSEMMHLFMARRDGRPPPAGRRRADRPRQAAFRQARRPPEDGGVLRAGGTRPASWAGASGRLPPTSAAANHLRFVERASRRLARASFHGMLVTTPKLQNKQAFLFRLVDIANETFAMAASVSRAQTLADTHAADEPRRYARGRVLPASKRQVRALFRGPLRATTTSPATDSGSRC